MDNRIISASKLKKLTFRDFLFLGCSIVMTISMIRAIADLRGPLSDQMSEVKLLSLAAEL